MYKIRTHPIDKEISSIQRDEQAQQHYHHHHQFQNNIENGFSKVNEIEGTNCDEFRSVLGSFHTVFGHRCTNGLRNDIETLITIIIIIT